MQAEVEPGHERNSRQQPLQQHPQLGRATAAARPRPSPRSR
ncbi:hypothetical protein [Hymenobacter sp. UYCo722]